jgi:integrase
MEILEELRRFHPHDGGDWVIAGARAGEPMGGYHKLWMELRDEVGLVDFRPHDLRHTFASLGLSAGHGLDVLGQLLGHTSIQSTRRYAHLVEDAARLAVARIEREVGV